MTPRNGNHGQSVLREADTELAVRLTEVYQVEADFEAKIRSDFDKMIDDVSGEKVNASD